MQYNNQERIILPKNNPGLEHLTQIGDRRK